MRNGGSTRAVFRQRAEEGGVAVSQCPVSQKRSNVRMGIVQPVRT